MKNKKRALRRHHYFRLKKLRRHHAHFRGQSEEYRDQHLGFYATTACPCSCAICRNPRRSHRGKDALTVQELKSVDWHNGKSEMYALIDLDEEASKDV